MLHQLFCFSRHFCCSPIQYIPMCPCFLSVCLAVFLHRLIFISCCIYVVCAYPSIICLIWSFVHNKCCHCCILNFVLACQQLSYRVYQPSKFALFNERTWYNSNFLYTSLLLAVLPQFSRLRWLPTDPAKSKGKHKQKGKCKQIRGYSQSGMHPSVMEEVSLQSNSLQNTCAAYVYLAI